MKALMAEAKRISEIHCMDGYCKFRGRRTGMHTNGGCHCTINGDGRRGHPYEDFIYMTNLLGLIVMEYEKENGSADQNKSSDP